MPCPIAAGSPSLHPSAGLWHVAQLIQPELERRGSKKSILPSSMRSAVMALSGGTGGPDGRRKDDSCPEPAMHCVPVKSAAAKTARVMCLCNEVLLLRVMWTPVT